MIHTRFIDRRPWVFTRRYYSPNDWRVPYFIWTRRWRYDASGKSFVMQLSYFHAAVRRLREA